MTKFQLDRPDGPWQYPTLGFVAVDGAILDGALSDPELTNPPDQFWSVYAGGSAETGVTRFPAVPGNAPSSETTDGYVLRYDSALNTWVPVPAVELLEDPDVAASLLASYVGRYTTIDVVADHGADPTGATSSVAAFEDAITAANALGGAVQIYVPPGTYDLKAGLTTRTITTPRVDIVGAGRGATEILIQDGTLFAWDNNATLGGVSDIRFRCPGTVGVTSLLFEVLTAARQTFQRLTVDNTYCVARFGGASEFASQPSVIDVNGYTANVAGAVAFDAVAGAVLTMRDVTIYANCGFPTNATDPHPAEAGTTGVRFGQGLWDTFVLHNVNLNRYDVDLDISVSTANVGNAYVTDCVFDYAKTNAVRLKVAAGGGGIRSIYFKGCWGVATDGHSWLIDSSNGPLQHVQFTDCVGRQAGKNNWRFVGSGTAAVQVLNCHGFGANRLAATNVGSEQDDLVILSSGVTVKGGWFGEDGQPYVGFTNQARYGITWAADIAIQITDVAASGATGGFQPPTNTVADFRRLITRNRRGSNSRPEYAPATAALAAPASAALQTNYTGFVRTLYIYGGTMTQVQHNGAQVAGAGPVTIVLNPGDTWAVYYTVAPTIMQSIAP